jgi:hypothetical protein
MMMNLVVGVVLFIGGSWPPLAASESIRPLNLILLDLDKHIGELTINLEDVAERIEVLRAMPSIDDPIIQELRKLDLKGWELHEEQWRLQLKHLKFAEDLLKKFHTGSGDKSELLKTWIDHEREYETTLEAYRNKRHAIEGARLQKEGKMIERYLR